MLERYLNQLAPRCTADDGGTIDTARRFAARILCGTHAGSMGPMRPAANDRHDAHIQIDQGRSRVTGNPDDADLQALGKNLSNYTVVAGGPVSPGPG